MDLNQIKANLLQLSVEQIKLSLLMIKQYNKLQQSNRILPGYQNDLFSILDELNIASKSYLKEQSTAINEIEFLLKETLARKTNSNVLA